MPASGKTIIDRINKISIGPARICHCVDFRLPGRRNIATRLAISVLLVHKIQRSGTGRFSGCRAFAAGQTPAFQLPYPGQHFSHGGIKLAGIC
jgi:hypothetical protein